MTGLTLCKLRLETVPQCSQRLHFEKKYRRVVLYIVTLDFYVMYVIYIYHAVPNKRERRRKEFEPNRFKKEMGENVEKGRCSPSSPCTTMRASTAPKHNHSRPTFAPTSVGTSLAFEFMARSLEIKSER